MTLSHQSFLLALSKIYFVFDFTRDFQDISERHLRYSTNDILDVQQVSLQHRSEIQNFKKRAVEIEARLRKSTKSNLVDQVESEVSNIEVQTCFYVSLFVFSC